MYLRKIFLLCFSCLCVVIYARDAIYVSPTGRDVAIGTIGQPVKTLDRALALSRKEHVKLICLKKGNYYDVGITLTPADSGLIICNYKNQKVTLYGGIPIRNFIKDGRFLVVKLPDNKRIWDFRMILVDGKLVDRSRLPETGFFHYKNEWKAKPLAALYGGWEREPTLEASTQLYYELKDLALWKGNWKNGEISMQQQWDESYTGIVGIDTLRAKIDLAEKASMPLGAYNHHDYVVWNTLEGVTRPGQWYWDKGSAKIYYWPKKGQKVDQILIPSQRNIIYFQKGTNNISIKGLTLSVSGNCLQNESFACINVDAAITGNQLANVHLEGMHILNVGGNGIRLEGSNISISHVSIRDAGGGGIYFGGKRIQITDCQFRNMGTIFSGSVGIRGNATNVLVSHCSIVDVPYSGVCLGCDSCKVEYCTIKKTMTTLLDGAAIYCGAHVNVDVFNNFIIGNNDGRFTMGIYFDELSQNCSAKNNIMINSGIPVHCHLSQNILYSNNLFIDKGLQRINYGGSSAIQLDRNIFIADSIVCSGPSVFDKKVDTLTVEPKFRKYANPSGMSSFRNNYLFSLSASAVKLPRVGEDAISETHVKYIKQNNIGVIITGLLKNKELKAHVDLPKMGITSRKLKEITKLVQNKGELLDII